MTSFRHLEDDEKKLLILKYHILVQLVFLRILQIACDLTYHFQSTYWQDKALHQFKDLEMRSNMYYLHGTTDMILFKRIKPTVS